MTFLYLLQTGMNDTGEPSWGSWAGRYGLNEEHPGKNYYWASQSDNWNGSVTAIIPLPTGPWQFRMIFVSAWSGVLNHITRQIITRWL